MKNKFLSLISYLINKENQEKGIEMLKNFLQAEVKDFIKIEDFSFNKENKKLKIEGRLLDEKQNTSFSVDIVNFRLEDDCILCVRFDSFKAEPQWLDKIIKIYLNHKKYIIIDNAYKRYFKRVEKIFIQNKIRTASKYIQFVF